MTFTYIPVNSYRFSCKELRDSEIDRAWKLLPDVFYIYKQLLRFVDCEYLRGTMFHSLLLFVLLLKADISILTDAAGKHLAYF